MRSLLLTTLVATALVAGPAWAQDTAKKAAKGGEKKTAPAAAKKAAADAETKVKMQDLPPAVQKAVKEQTKGATLKGLTKEVEEGKTFYEAETTVAGHGKDILFDADGNVVSVEEEVAIDKIPAAARDAIQKAVGTGKLAKLETVKEKGNTFYEGHIKKGAKETEVKVDANGKPVK
jgi:uncharacterized membrane protein YkoI